MPRRRSHRTRPKPEESTAYEKAVVVLLLVIPMVAMAGYGAVDVWFLIPLAFLTMVLLVLWAIDSLKRGEVRFSNSRLQLPILGIIAIGCVQLLPFGDPGNLLPGLDVSAALSIDPFATRIFTIRLFLLFIFFAAVLAYVNAKPRAQRLVTILIVFGAAMAFAGILLKLISPEAIYGLRPTPQAIPFGPFVNQHHFAAFMEMTIGVTAATLIGGAVASDRKPLYIIALALMLIAVVMTGSRGGMIGVVAVLMFLGVASYAVDRGRSSPRSEKLATALGAAALLIVAAAAAVFVAGADPLVRGIGLQETQGDVTSGRTHFWAIAFRIFLDNPVLGAGLDAFGVAFTRYDTWNGTFRVEQAHNDYLQILADAGIAGFVCVAGFIVLLFKQATSVIRRSITPGRRSIALGALAGCVGILVHSFFDFPLRTPSNSYFFLLLAALATVPLGDEREPNG